MSLLRCYVWWCGFVFFFLLFFPLWLIVRVALEIAVILHLNVQDGSYKNSCFLETSCSLNRLSACQLATSMLLCKTDQPAKAARFCVAASFCLMHQKDKNSCLSGIHLNGKLINVVIFWRMLRLNELFPFFFSPCYLLLWCQEYLTKLGNTECHPEQFLKRRAALDKLLIIIQNEDIDNLIHKVLHISKCVPQKTTVKA